MERKQKDRDAVRRAAPVTSKPARKKPDELTPPPMVRQRPASRERRAAELEMSPDDPNVESNDRPEDVVLKPAKELAALNPVRLPNESKEYRRARNALLAEEIELRRHIERVAEQRRHLPPGGKVTKDYRFDGENGPVGLADLFGDKQTLVIYNYMFGPQRKRPCPMCTSLMSAWDGEARDIEQRAAFAMVARSPIDRLVAFKKERGWKNLKLYSDPSGEYTRDYVSKEDADQPGYNVFTRRDGVIRHFWGAEMFAATADPGQDPRGAPDFMPIWTILDTTPEGRGKDWYPKLEYPKSGDIL